MNIVYQVWEEKDEYVFADFDFPTLEKDMDKIGQLLVDHYKGIGAIEFYLDSDLSMVHLITKSPSWRGQEVTRVTHHMVKWLEME